MEGLNRGTGSTLGGPSRFLRSLSLGFQFLDRISNPVTNMSSTGREPLGGGGVPFRSGCYLSSSTSLLLSSSSNSLGVISALYQLPQLQASDESHRQCQPSYGVGSIRRDTRRPILGSFCLLLGFAFVSAALYVSDEPSPPIEMSLLRGILWILGFAVIFLGLNLVLGPFRAPF